jgi:predicted porin
MKKHLIAAAVAAAVAVPAAAQVTVYGNIDSGFQMRDSDVINKTTGVVTATEAAAVTFSSDSTSRLGFRASEDLGGGLKAAVVLETGLGSSGDVGTTSSIAATSLGSRLKFVALSGGFGTLRTGYQTSTTKDAWAVADAGGASNVDGNWDDLSDGDFDKRVSAINYITPSMSGFSASVGITSNSTKVTGKTDTEVGSGYMAALNYKNGPIQAMFAYNDADTKTPAVALVNPTPGDTGKAAAAQVNANEERMVLALAYDLGMAKLHLGYADREYRDTITASKDEDDDYWTIGLSVPMGATSVFASFSQGDSRVGTNVVQDKDAMQIGARYAMSKRTGLYAIYGQTNWDKTTSTDGTEVSAFAIGVNHKF